jgi:hypothetical protein
MGGDYNAWTGSMLKFYDWILSMRLMGHGEERTANNSQRWSEPDWHFRST